MATSGCMVGRLSSSLTGSGSLRSPFGWVRLATRSPRAAMSSPKSSGHEVRPVAARVLLACRCSSASAGFCCNRLIFPARRLFADSQKLPLTSKQWLPHDRFMRMCVKFIEAQEAGDKKVAKCVFASLRVRLPRLPQLLVPDFRALVLDVCVSVCVCLVCVMCVRVCCARRVRCCVTPWAWSPIRKGGPRPAAASGPSTRSARRSCSS